LEGSEALLEGSERKARDKLSGLKGLEGVQRLLAAMKIARRITDFIAVHKDVSHIVISEIAKDPLDALNEEARQVLWCVSVIAKQDGMGLPSNLQKTIDSLFEKKEVGTGQTGIGPPKRNGEPELQAPNSPAPSVPKKEDCEPGRFVEAFLGKFQSAGGDGERTKLMLELLRGYSSAKIDDREIIGARLCEACGQDGALLDMLLKMLEEKNNAVKITLMAAYSLAGKVILAAKEAGAQNVYAPIEIHLLKFHINCTDIEGKLADEVLEALTETKRGRPKK